MRGNTSPPAGVRGVPLTRIWKGGFQIGGELEQRGGGRGHEQPVDALLVRAGKAAQLGRKGEGDEVVGARQQARALLVEPALSLVPVALGTMPVPARMVAVLPRAAVIAGLHVAAEGRRAARRDVVQGAELRGMQERAMEPAVDVPDRADDVRELEHRRGRAAQRPRIKRLMGSTAVWRTSGVRWV